MILFKKKKREKEKKEKKKEKQATISPDANYMFL